MIRTYLFKNHANLAKEAKIKAVIAEYRKYAALAGVQQIKNLFTTGKTNKYDNTILNYEGALSARYKQNVVAQVTAQYDGFISNMQNLFKDIIYHSSIKDEKTRIQLYYINKHSKWFENEIPMRGEEIPENVILTARKIFKRCLKINRFPNVSKINMALNFNVCSISQSKKSSFDYWMKISTLEKNKPVMIPIKTYDYFEKVQGEKAAFSQINLDSSGNMTFGLIKKLTENETLHKTDVIALDVGLRTLFTSNRGDLFGKNFIDKLTFYDNRIQDIQSKVQSSGLKPSQSKKLRSIVRKCRSYIKNEVNRNLNRIIEIYSPKEIVVEKLNFTSPDLSRRLNRLLSKFGKNQISLKLKMMAEELQIKVTEINPAYTSQTCSSCGYVDSENRKSQKEFECKACGNTLHADVNGAMNILDRRSIEEITPFTKKEKVLNLLVQKFITNLSDYHKNWCCSSSAKILDIVRGNKYFEPYQNQIHFERT